MKRSEDERRRRSDEGCRGDAGKSEKINAKKNQHQFQIKEAGASAGGKERCTGQEGRKERREKFKAAEFWVWRWVSLKQAHCEC